jgi:nucleotide-binding universal stress UspA family protein
MKTLIATDGSTYAATALNSAAQLLTRENNAFAVTCISPSFSPPPRVSKRSPGGMTELQLKYQEEMSRKADKVVKEARKALAAAGIESHAFTETGSPADVLIRLSDDYDAVVVGTQSGGERPGPGLGPVVSRVVEHVSGIVLVGRRLLNEKSFRVLIGVDGSASSENAMEAFVNSFQSRDAEVTVMHVVERPWLRLGLGDPERPYADASDQPESDRLLGRELWLEAEQIVEHTRARLARRCSSIESRIVEGSPSNEILQEAEIGDYDLAILGSTGVSDLKHTMLGSVSFKLASSAPCSVALIR